MKLQPGTKVRSERVVRTHKSEPWETTDIDVAPEAKWMLNTLARLYGELKNLSKIVEDRTKPVDEFTPQTTMSTELTLEIQPTYEIPVRVTSILVTGPAGQTVTVTVGPRNWTVVIPASGVLVIAPISMIVNREDHRTITATVAGDYSLELMGWA